MNPAKDKPKDKKYENFINEALECFDQPEFKNYAISHPLFGKMAKAWIESLYITHDYDKFNKMFKEINIPHFHSFYIYHFMSLKI